MNSFRSGEGEEDDSKHAAFLRAYEGLNEQGAALLTKLANLYIKLGYAEGLSWGVLATVEDVQVRVINELTRERLVLTGELYALVTQMTEMVEHAPARAVEGHEKDKDKDRASVSVSVSVSGVDAYDKDILVKKAVLHDFMTLDDIDHDSLQVYIAAWSSMPFIPKLPV